MNNKRMNFLLAVNIAIIGFFVVHAFVLGHFFTSSRTLSSDIIQGILVGFAMAFILSQIIARFKAKKINGWVTICGCGDPANGMLTRAACAQIFPGPINVPKEAMYWTTYMDGDGHTLSGQNKYILHFPPGGLPPNNAFWSLTMGDSQNRFVPNPINRYSVSSHSSLMQNTDGSTDIYIQNTTPLEFESNWLPAPTGSFILWLRVYMPGKTILDGEYKVPPIVGVK